MLPVRQVGESETMSYESDECEILIHDNSHFWTIDVLRFEWTITNCGTFAFQIINWLILLR